MQLGSMTALHANFDLKLTEELLLKLIANVATTGAIYGEIGVKRTWSDLLSTYFGLRYGLLGTFCKCRVKRGSTVIEGTLRLTLNFKDWQTAVLALVVPTIANLVLTKCASPQPLLWPCLCVVCARAHTATCIRCTCCMCPSRCLPTQSHALIAANCTQAGDRAADAADGGAARRAAAAREAGRAGGGEAARRGAAEHDAAADPADAGRGGTHARPRSRQGAWLQTLL